jgi:MSHA biogenesis protein MshJ
MLSWQLYESKFDALIQREKVMALAAGIVVIVLMGFTYGIEPFWRENQDLQVESTSLERKLNSLNQQQQTYALVLAQDPDADVKAQLVQLKKRTEQVENQFSNEINKLVPPSQMPKLMASVLGLSKALELQQVNALPPEPLFTSSTNNNSDNKNAKLYQHTIRLVFKGNFENSLHFLNALEQTEWQVYWSVMTFTVKEHPDSELIIEFYTLSTEKVFIRV